MVQISNPVGCGAASAKHDVAVVQAALKNIKIGNKPIWPGTIDGRKNTVLEQAIMAFQIARRIKPTGKVETNGPTMRALNSALPRALVNMRGVKGTCAVFVSPVGAREADREARKVKSEAPFPANESAGLATIFTNVGRGLGICLERKREFVTQDGRFAVELDFMKVLWIGNSTGRLLPAGRESRGATQAVCRLVQSVPEWAVGSTSDLVFTSNRQVPALKGIGAATAADLKVLGLTQSPKHEVPSAIVAACAKLVRSGEVATKSGRAEHRILLDAVSSVDKTLAARLETVATICHQLKVDLGNLRLEEESVHKDFAEASDALAVRSKELGIIADEKLESVKIDFVKAFKEFDVFKITKFTIKVARVFINLALSLASAGRTLNEIDEILREDPEANKYAFVFKNSLENLALIKEKQRAVIKRQKELGCP